jgi:hypothetical protein
MQVFNDLINLEVFEVEPQKIQEEVTPFRLFNGAPKVINLSPIEMKPLKRKIKYSISSKEEAELKRKLKTVQVTAQEIRDQAHWWVMPDKWNRRILNVSDPKKLKRRRSRKRS